MADPAGARDEDHPDRRDPGDALGVVARPARHPVRPEPDLIRRGLDELPDPLVRERRQGPLFDGREADLRPRPRGDAPGLLADPLENG